MGDFWRSEPPIEHEPAKMGMWWESVAVMGVMFGVVQGLYSAGMAIKYAHGGKWCGRGSYNQQQVLHSTRDRNNSYSTWLINRTRRQGVDNCNINYLYGLEKLPSN